MSSVPQMLELAVKYHQAGNFHQAELHYRQILQIEPRHANAMHLLGMLAYQVGRSDVAIDTIQKALLCQPDFPTAHNNLGNILRFQGRVDEAIAHLQQAVRSKPDYAEAYSNLGNALMDLGKVDEAIDSYRHCLRLRPDFAEVYSNLGNALRDQGKMEEAIANCRECLRRKPDYAEAHNNLGTALQDMGRLDEAIIHYRQVQQLQPKYAEVVNNLATAAQDQGRFDDGLATFRQALRMQPDNANAHFNLAMLSLLLGDFEEGWKYYEWRWQSRDFLRKRYIRPPLSDKFWNGSPLQGRTILLHAEQGLGDTLQFIRYAALLKQQGAGQVMLACSPELQRMMRQCPSIDRVLTTAPTDGYDVDAFLMSLPWLVKTTSLERIPAHVPYLDCDPIAVEQWESRLTSLKILRPALRVGIAWQGNPNHERDRRRSLPLAQFAPLAELPGVRLVSLQKGAGSEQLAKLPGLAVDLGPELTDLADTAAVIRCLDLVISVDTAVAHLAGALGAPVWLTLPSVPDWRWLLKREDSPWYPRMRLFRQTLSGEWDDVFRRIREALAERST